MPDIEFADQYQNVLMSMESMIASVYRENSELTDYEVSLALDALIKDYRGEAIGHEPKMPTNAAAQPVYTKVDMVCGVFLGRAEIETKKGQKPMPKLTPLTVDEIIGCLKYLRKSVDFWTKSHGRQGYLDYIKNFV